jgi:hypothetical protein
MELQNYAKVSWCLFIEIATCFCYNDLQATNPFGVFILCEVLLGEENGYT